MKTNQMHFLSLIYFINQPLPVLGLFISHHHEVFTVHVQQLVHAIHSHLDPTSCQSRKHTTHTDCCTYTVITS
jgi:hypothetical protein